MTLSNITQNHKYNLQGNFIEMTISKWTCIQENTESNKTN